MNVRCARDWRLGRLEGAGTARGLARLSENRRVPDRGRCRDWSGEQGGKHSGNAATIPWEVQYVRCKGIPARPRTHIAESPDTWREKAEAV